MDYLQNNAVAPNNENNPAVMNITQALEEVNNEFNNNIANEHNDMDAQNNHLVDDDVDMEEWRGPRWLQSHTVDKSRRNEHSIQSHH